LSFFKLSAACGIRNIEIEISHTSQTSQPSQFTTHLPQAAGFSLPPSPISIPTHSLPQTRNLFRLQKQQSSNLPPQIFRLRLRRTYHKLRGLNYHCTHQRVLSPWQGERQIEVVDSSNRGDFEFGVWSLEFGVFHPRDSDESLYIYPGIAAFF